MLPRPRWTRSLAPAIASSLVLLALGSCVEPAPAAPAAPSPVAAGEAALGFDDVRAPDSHTWQGFLFDAYSIHDPRAQKALSFLGKMRTLSEHLRNYQRCVSEGKDQQGCAATFIRWGVCLLATGRLTQLMSPTFAMLGLPLNALCNGDPALKCCQYTGETTFCHSAFNSPSPINCEGNPLGGQSYGPCAPRNAFEGDIGCFCDYLPECATSGVSDSPTAQAWRISVLATGIADAVPLVLAGDATHPPDLEGFGDFVSLTGCAAHRSFVLGSVPFEGTGSLPTGYALPSYYTAPAAPEAAYQRDLTTIAVQRILGGIPNVSARWNSVNARHFTAAERAAYLAPVGDPAVVLGRLLGPFGLRLLQLAHPQKWDLLAVPLATEPADANSPAAWPYVAACVPAAAPDLALEVVENAAAKVALRLNLQDPQEETDDLRVHPVAIDWGDGRVEQLLRFVDDPVTHVVRHTYRAAGAKTIRAWTMNSAGLTGFATLTLTVASGEPAAFSDPALSVATVTLELDALITSFLTHGYVSVDVSALDATGGEHGLGRLFRKPNPAPSPFSTATLALRDPLPNDTLSEVMGLRLRPIHYTTGSASYAVLRLGLIRFTKLDGTVIEWRPTANDVQVFAPGASTPVAPTLDPASGMLEMPLHSAEIVIRRGTGPARDPWCRPLYTGTAPAFRSALGGCQDVQGGLVWSVASAPISWHDAVWDSRLAGNAPVDAADGARIADYPASNTGPDASLVNYCHALVEGGYSDWRLPSDTELLTFTGAAKAGTFAGTLGHVWTSTSWTDTYVVVRDLVTGERFFTLKTGREMAICVRGPVVAAGTAIGGACTANAACNGGFCVDGVCCSDACGGGAVDDCLACSAAAGAAADGTCTPVTARACDDGRACSSASTCRFGVCEATAAVACAAAGPCEGGAACVEATGTCRPIPVEDGRACDDVNACTLADRCVAGSCRSGAPVACAAPPACQVQDACNPSTGLCPALHAAADGTSCDDGNPCTKDDSCHSGGCRGAPVACAAIDACHEAGSCDEATGRCSTPAKIDGTGCDDGSACTQGDSCHAGTCGGEPVVCAALDACHEAGSCDEATGRCSTPAKADGTACDDGSACTQGDSCRAGSCGGEPVVCAALDACHAAGICDEATGQCSTPAKEDGTTCDDGSACTLGDSCHAGTCGGEPVVCAAGDACHEAGSCEPSTGACSTPAKADGTACADGTCTDGHCAPATTDGGAGTGAGSPAAGDAGCGGGCAATSPASLGLLGALAVLRRRWR